MGKNHSDIFYNNYYAIKWLFRITPGYTLYSIIFSIVTDICILFEHTFMVAYIINCIEHNKPLSELLVFFVPVTSVILLRFLIMPFVEAYMEPKVNEKINREIKFSLYEKAVNMDVSKYDNPEFYNDFIWAMQDAPSHINGALKSFSSLISVIITTFVVGFYMIFSDAIGLIFVFGTVIISFLCRLNLNKKQIALQNLIIPLRRKRDYISRVFYLADYAKDLKTSDMSKILYSNYKEASDSMEDTIKTHGKKLVLLDYISSIFQKVLTFDGFYLSYLLYQTFILQSFSYGVLIALYNSSSKMKSSIDSFVNIIPQFQQHSLYIEKLRNFLETENEIKDEGQLSVPENGLLKLINVHFCYPQNKDETLCGISFKINKGDKIALVGHNGAGKSTLVKLLMRFYDPSSGEVYFDDKKLCEYPLNDYRRRIGVVFQDYEIIAATLGENITMSCSDPKKEKIFDIFDKTDFSERYHSLPDGLNTILTKEFDNRGINLSGGEAQKVALSRVLYSDASILIFDEPSSALDPIAEYQFNQTVLDIARDKTIIIITHRLSTTKFVDKIYMMETGKIVESGTHEQLIQQNGKYAEMYNLQASKYR